MPIFQGILQGIERGIRNPTIVILAKLAETLDVEPGELLERVGRNS